MKTGSTLLMKPLSLSADRQDALGRPRYRVVFQAHTGAIEHSFTVSRNNDCVVESQDPHAPENIKVMTQLFESILAFDEASQSLLFEGQPLSGLLPGRETHVIQKKAMQLLSLVSLETNAEGAHCYSIRLQCDRSEVEYAFEVNDSDLLGVQWEHQFWIDMGANLDPATPLFKALLAFHKARQSTTQCSI